MDRYEHELAIERVDDLRTLERDRVVRKQVVETGDRRPRRRLDPIARRVGPHLVGLRLLVAERELHPYLHALRPLARPHFEILEHDDPPVGTLADRFFVQRLDRPDIRRLRDADLAVIDLEAELRHQRRLDIAHHLLRRDVALGEDVYLAHLAERRRHHARRQHAGQRRDQVLQPLHPPRIGSASAERQVGLVRCWCRTGCHVDFSSGSVAVATPTRFRPAALARYSARSAATSTSSSFFSGRYSATPMLAVTSRSGYPIPMPAPCTAARTFSATPRAPSSPVPTNTTTNSSPPYRPARSVNRMWAVQRRAVSRNTAFPASCPNRSFTCLKLSRSKNSTAKCSLPRWQRATSLASRSRSTRNDARPVSASTAACCCAIDAWRSR